MRLTLHPVIFASLASAFVVELWEYHDDGSPNKNCSGEPYRIEDWDSNCKCPSSGVPSAWSIKYRSDIGCTLGVFVDAKCEGLRTDMFDQDTCLAPDYEMHNFECCDEGLDELSFGCDDDNRIECQKQERALQ